MELLPLACLALAIVVVHVISAEDSSVNKPVKEPFSTVRHLPTERSVRPSSKTLRPLFYWDTSLQTTTSPPPLAIIRVTTPKTIPRKNTTDTDHQNKRKKKKKKDRLNKRKRKNKRNKRLLLAGKEQLEEILKRNRTLDGTDGRLGPDFYLKYTPKKKYRKFRKLKKGNLIGGGAGNWEEPNELTVLENELAAVLSTMNREENWKKRMGCDCDHYCDKATKSCGCFKGFYLAKDGRTCKDVDECVINNGGCEHLCHNTIGRYSCSCRRGWRLHENGRCLDINECRLNNGHGPCSHKCINVPGSYKCSCEGLVGTSLEANGKRCRVDNEPNCKKLAGCSHTCLVARAGTSVYCTCPEGFYLGEDWKTCRDIDECLFPEINSTCSDGCENLPGSYRCLETTPEPAQLVLPPSDNTTTALPDLSDLYVPPHVVCPPLFPPRHGFIECFREKSVFHPTAPSGRRRMLNRPGSICQLFCPLGYRKDGKWKKVCGLDGTWKGDDDGKCVQYPQPTIKCPSPIVNRLKPDEKALRVAIPAPVSNLETKFIHSQPQLINSTITLPRGQHWVHFTATHPITSISAKCSTYVVIKGAPTT